MTDKQNYFTYTDNTSDNNDKIMENLHKQIIDGIDVSKCGFFHFKEYGNTDCHIALAFSEEYSDCMKCEQNPNCYFKQLARKTQECEELKKIINEAKNSKLDLKSFLVGEAVQNEYEQQLDQLKQILAEIKEIAEPFCNACQEFEPEKSKNCINCTYCNYNKILQKISQCEVKNK